ncbi:MAG: hypothetical protein RJA22_1524 [Verrucomicrobiota bacterium]|jgi:NADPH2:quinone reductase
MQAIRAHRFGGPEVLQLEEIPQPTPGPGQVLVRIHAAGVNPVETYLRSGANPGLPLPWTPGHDGAGVIESVGPGVTTRQPGDRVYLAGTLTGSYAQFALAEARTTHPLPPALSFAQGAAVGIPYATAHRALFQRGQARPGETVFVHGGSGGVGLAAIQMARAAGLTVLASAGTETGRRLATAEGAHHVVDHRAPDYLDQVLALTHGRGVDVLLEMLANVNLGRDLPLLARGGRVLVIGSRGKVEITPRDLMMREADIRAVYLFHASPAEYDSLHAALAAGLAHGTLRPIVGRELPLAQAPQAHAAVLEPGAHGKIVLVP